MIKKIMVVFLVLALTFCVACGGKSLPETTTCEQILTAATSAQSYGNVKTYIKGKVELDAFFMSLWADGSFEECQEFDLISDYAICYSNDNKTFEIAILRAEKPDDVARLQDLLERRKQTLSQGDKAEYDPDFKELMSNCKIITDEKFVMLLITEDNASVVNAIENLKK